ncbi:MAG: hypothetical protein IJU48_10320 [Synergistaceae bacterium]|nr:hypothetical protein [Synergistaceae bacterium]
MANVVGSNGPEILIPYIKAIAAPEQFTCSSVAMIPLAQRNSELMIRQPTS